MDSDTKKLLIAAALVGAAFLFPPGAPLDIAGVGADYLLVGAL